MTNDILPREVAKSAHRLLDNARKTLRSIQEQVGLSTEMIRRTEELLGSVDATTVKLGQLEHVCEAPIKQKGEEREHFVQSYQRLQREHRELARQITAQERDLAVGQVSGISDEVRSAANLLEESRNAAQQKKNRLDAMGPKLEEARAELAVLESEVDDKYRELLPQFADIQVQADTLNSAAHELYTEINDRPLAEKGVEQVHSESTTFKDARDYHRKQAGRLLVGLLILAVVGAALIWWLYNPKPMGADNNVDIIHVVTVLGGRITAVALIAWMVYFLGKLHAAHSQQAVTYHDRLAGLEAAEVIINYGQRESREEVLRNMTRAYFALETNAFAPICKAKFPEPLKEVSKLATELAKLVRVVRGDEAPSVMPKL